MASATSPTVSLDYGVFQGAVDGNLSTFLGVPFAQPAVRFSLPQPPTLLHGVQNATAFGPACPQQALSPVPLPVAVPDEGVVSEDCLKLNVFAPRAIPPHSKLPVFVWIYGGGFEVGNAPDTEEFTFGFLAGKEVGDAGITNLGLRDQIFALKWCQKHIAAFGGDPARVVIGGPSAGAISAALLLLNNKQFEPAALFRGAFMLSGSPITTGSVADGQPHYDELVLANNCTGSNDTLECLRRVPLDSFMATVNHTTNLLSFSSLQNIWRPRVDGDVVVHNPLVSVSEGLYARVPFMTGDADDEGTLFSLSNTNITTDEEFVGYVHSNYLPRSTPAQIAQIATLYPDDPTQGSPFGSGLANQFTPQFKRLAALQGDYLFIGTRRFFLEHASKTQNTWSWLSKRGKSTPIVGASHGSDVGIWFPAANTTDFAPVDALINFINALDPNHSSSTKTNASQTVFWPKWNTPTTDGSPSLLTLSDPGVINVTSENFRVDAIQVLLGLLLEEAVSG
ncbi:carotenoid ester lipase precursor [Mycena alexandri]|uniref:Carboxylic ester hydrolase n=1 Tax=Mycena alexandri TaxID=1745969 RepID=A0AAD6X0L8_9AGAR|nr:carotenoid ester lipase precursor [Mycena alexandri]